MTLLPLPFSVMAAETAFQRHEPGRVERAEPFVEKATAAGGEFFPGEIILTAMESRGRHPEIEFRRHLQHHPPDVPGLEHPFKFLQ